MRDLQLSEVTASNLISTLRTKGIIETIGKKDRIAIYQFYTGTPITIPKREIPPIDPQCFRQALEELCSTASQLGRAAIALLEMWDQGVQTFSYSLLRDKTQLTIEQVPKVCYQLKERGIITGSQGTRAKSRNGFIYVALPER